MLELTPATVAVVATAAFLIGLTKAGLGGGLGPAITALMVLALPVEVALGVQLPMLIVADVFAVGAFWRRWAGGHVLRLIAGAIPGVVAGSYLLAAVDAVTIQRLIGVVSLTFVGYRLVQPRLTRIAALHPGPALGLGAGALGGVASTVAHAGAPPVSAYLLLARVTPVEYTATHILVFALINLLKVPGYLAAGFAYPDLSWRLSPTLVLLPVGVAVGRWLVSRVSAEVFDRIILGVLTVIGLHLLL